MSSSVEVSFSFVVSVHEQGCILRLLGQSITLYKSWVC